MLDTCKEIFSLMCDMAEEGLEKARIKAQQNRIREIIRIDEKELEGIYAKIGRIDVLGKDKDKREELIAAAKKIEARILRAEVRLEMLKNAASVDECTKAFEEKLMDTAQNVRDFAKEKSSDIKEKIKDASSDLTAKAEDLTIKAKDKAADLSIKAKEKAGDIKEKLPKSAPKEAAEDLNADEQVLDNVDDILKRIEDTINSVDEESAEEFKF